MKLSLLVFLVFATYLANAQLVPTVTPIGFGALASGEVFPCGIDYYITPVFSATPGAYAVFSINNTVPVTGNTVMYIGYDTDTTSLDDLPDETFHIAQCAGTCELTVSCGLQNAAFYIGVAGGLFQAIKYNVTVRTATVPVNTGVQVSVPITRLNAQAPSPTPDASDFPQNYIHYAFTMPTNYDPIGTYFAVSLYDVETNVTGLYPTLLLNTLPLPTSEGGCVSGLCITYDNGNPEQTSFTSCSCSVDLVNDECNVTFSACYTQLGQTYYFSVFLPSLVPVEFNYTVEVNVFTTRIVDLVANTTYYNGYSEPASPGHFRLAVQPSQIVPGQTKLRVKVDNVVGGQVTLYVNEGELAGPSQGCNGSIADCTTNWACNVVLEKCYFSPLAIAAPSTWYFAVEVVDPDTNSPYLNGLVTYTITAYLETDPAPKPIDTKTLAPFADTVYEAQYNFYVLDVPKTVDTWLFVELYANQNDTEVILYMLHGELPGGECYAYPDFYCQTGDHDSCQFALQPCELKEGPLYFAVYGQWVDTTPYGDNTYYDYPVHYTLYVDYEVAVQVRNKVSYSEHVYPGQYSHYYIVAKDISLGQYMTVEISDIQGGSINGFVNKNYLAGACPCFANTHNCTGDIDPDSCGNYDSGSIPTISDDFCLITVGSCEFDSGIWYVSVYGGEADSGWLNAIGYTLTVTIYPAPHIGKIDLNEYKVDSVGFNDVNHYRLDVDRSDNKGKNLILELVYVTDEEFIDTDNPIMMLGLDTLATPQCYVDYCVATAYHGNESYSYCTIQVPWCMWEKGQYYVAVYGNLSSPANPNVRYTVRARTEKEPVDKLTSGTAYFGRLYESRYHHYYIDVRKTTSNYLFVEMYINSDQGLPQDIAKDYTVDYTAVLYMNYEELAGGLPCHDYLDYYECNTTNSCYWMIENCDLRSGRYYFSVFAEKHQFFDVGVEYTFRATIENNPTDLVLSQPVQGYIWDTMIDHWRFNVTPQMIQQYQSLTILIANVRHGSIKASLFLGSRAGPCPCYNADLICTAEDGGQNWCSFEIPYCMLVTHTGSYYIAVEGTQNDLVGGVYTPIGYTIEAILPTPIITTNAQLGQFYQDETLPAQVYHHYQFTAPTSTLGSVLRVNFSDVKDGGVSGWITFGSAPGDDSCGGIPVSGIMNLPICLLSTNSGTFWLTVEAFPNSVNVTYNFTVSIITPTALNNTPIHYNDDLYRVFVIPNLAKNPGQQLQIRIENITEGSLLTYINQPGLTQGGVNGGLAWPRGSDNQCCGDTIEVLEGYNPCTGSEIFPGTCYYTVPSCAWNAGPVYVTTVPTSGDADFYIYYVLVDTLGTPITLQNGVTSSQISLTGAGQFATFTIAVSGSTSLFTRLVVQTNFLTTTTPATVYVLPNSPANPGSCSTYTCSNGPGNGCNSVQKYVNETCCLEDGTYFILVQQTAPGSVDFTVEATIYNAQATTPLTIGTTVDFQNGGGVPGETVTNYQLALTSAQLSSNDSLVINVTNTDNPTSIYFRRGYAAGPSLSNGRCYGNDLSNTCGGDCFLYVPGCHLTAATYYVGLYNPVFDTVTNYTLDATLRPTNQLSLGQWSNTTIWGAGTYAHYFIDIDASVVTQSSAIQFQLISLAGGSIQMAISDVGLAGDYDCLDDSVYNQATCSPSCTAVLSICSGLSARRYWISVFLASGSFADYALLVSQIQTVFQPLSFVTNSAGDYIWTVSNDTDLFSYYLIDTSAAGITVTDRSNFLINITNVVPGIGGPGTMTITLADSLCRSYACDASTVNGGCIIEDDQLSPCAFFDTVGPYYLVIFNPAGLNFSLVATLRSPALTQITADGTVYTNQQYIDRWYHYQVFTPESLIGYGGTLTVDVSASCGAVEMYINHDTTSGPLCNIATCQTDPTSPSDPVDSCSITLDSCELDWGSYLIAVRVIDQEFQSSSAFLYIGAKYTVDSVLVPYTFSPFQLMCENIVPSNIQTQQFYLDVESANIGAYMFLSLELPEGVDPNDYNGAGFTVVRNSSVAPSCPTVASCTFDGSKTVCATRIEPWNMDATSKYFVSFIATAFSEFEAALIDPNIPIIDVNKPYYGTVAEQFYVYHKFFVDPAQTNLLITVTVFNVTGGELTVYLRNGLEPLGYDYHYGTDTEVANYTLTSPNRILYGLPAYEFVVDPCVDIWSPWFISIYGEDQTCPNKSISYVVQFTTQVTPKPLNVPDLFCDTVYSQAYTYYHLLPAVQASTPTIPRYLFLEVYDVDNGNVSLHVFDGDIATKGACSVASCNTETNSTGGCYILYECDYTNLYVSVYGEDADNVLEPISYRIHTNYSNVPVTTLTNNTVFSMDDPYCGGEVDYYRIDIPAGTNTSLAYLDIVLTQADPNGPSGTMWVSFNNIPSLGSTDTWSCSDQSCTTAVANGDTANNCHVFFISCELGIGTYYVAVENTAPYSIVYRLYPNAAAPLTLDQPSAVQTIAVDQYQFFYVDIPAGSAGVTNYLAVTVDGYAYGDLRITTNYDALPDDDSDPACSINTTTITYGSARALWTITEVNECQFRSGRFFIGVYGVNQKACQEPTYTITASVQSRPAPVTTLTANTPTVGSISAGQLNHYSFAQASNNVNTLLHVRLWDVNGGTLRVNANPLRLAIPSEGTPLEYPCKVAYCDTTKDDISCAFYVDQCNYLPHQTGANWYFSVEVLSQDFALVPVTYRIVVSEETYTTISTTANTPSTGTFSNADWEYDFFTINTQSVQSLTLHFDVTGGDGVYVAVYDSPCDYNAFYRKNFFCSRRYTDSPNWLCELEIFTREAHPGATNFYIYVYGKNGTYSAHATIGRNGNCQTPSAESLAFCSSYVNYPTWIWSNFASRDEQAECFYEEIKEEYFCNDCFCGITPDCDNALRQYACLSTMPNCDQSGFESPVCRVACEAVVYYCADYFESVDLEFFNCTAPFYEQSNKNCAGSEIKIRYPRASKESSAFALRMSFLALIFSSIVALLLRFL